MIPKAPDRPAPWASGRASTASGDDYAEDLPNRLLRKVEETKYPQTVLNYFSPANIFGADVASPPMTFPRRG